MPTQNAGNISGNNANAVYPMLSMLFLRENCETVVLVCCIVTTVYIVPQYCCASFAWVMIMKKLLKGMKWLAVAYHSCSVCWECWWSAGSHWSGGEKREVVRDCYCSWGEKVWCWTEDELNVRTEDELSWMKAAGVRENHEPCFTETNTFTLHLCI